MSVPRPAGRRVTRGAVAALVLGLYVVLLGAGPLEHHDLACHLKSRTHCTTCVYASVPGDDTGSGEATAALPVVSLVGSSPVERPSAGAELTRADRAPPAC